MTQTSKPADRSGSLAHPLNDAPLISKTNNVDETTKKQVVEAYGKFPLSFEANKGQTNARVKFSARGNGYGLYLTSQEAVMVLRAGPAANEQNKSLKSRASNRILKMKLAGANSHSRIVGFDELPGKSNYFIGNDPKKWRTDVPNFSKVKYENIYSGVDMVYRGNQGQLEYDFVVAPRADTNVIRLDFEGADSRRLDANGDLILTLGGEEVRSHKPAIYQEQEGGRQEVAGSYVLIGKKQVGFEVGAYDRSKPLIIDPVLIYSTYLGGLEQDYGYGIAVDADGNAYLSGETLSTDFPVVNAFQPVLAGSTSGSFSTDAFVVKLNAAGNQLVYSTFLGGHADLVTYDRGRGIAVDSSGCAYVTGETANSDFPILNAFQTAWGGGFITKLSAAGNTLVYSSHVYAYDLTRVAVDASGNAYVVGHRGDSANYQPVNPIQQTFGGGYADIILAKVSASGSSLLYYSYLGGNGDDRALDVALDVSGNIYISGSTTSTNLPVVNAYQSTFAGTGTCGLSPNTHPCTDGFVAKLNSSGSSYLYFTYLGGTSDDQATGIRVDSAGYAFVVGQTSSTNFPTTAGAYQTTFGGEVAASGSFGDAFVTKLDTGGNALIYSTYLGGNDGDGAKGVAIDSSGNAYVVGSARSTNFPSVNALMATSGVGSDVFVTKLNSLGNGLTYSTRLGGATYEEGNAIAVDLADDAYIIGTTNSTDFPVSSAYQSTIGAQFAGRFDAVIAKISSSDGNTISGHITDGGGNSVTAVTVTLNGPRTLTTQTDTNGFYSFPFLKPGENYTITPTKNLYIFNPVNQSFTNLAADQTADFIATTSSTTYTISGRVLDSFGVGTAGINMTLSGSLSNSTQTDAGGNYSFSQLVGTGNYTVTPSKSAYDLTYFFTPPSRTYNNLSANQVGDFTVTTSRVLTINAIADAYVEDGTVANTNFGNTTPLLLRSDNQAGQRRDVYFKYDLSEVSRNITNAKLRIYAGLSASGSISTTAFGVTDTLWNESAITWNNKPQKNATAITGATVAVTSTTFATYDIDITPYILTEKAAGHDVVSFALHNGSNTTPYILLNSREAATNKPQLVITTVGNNNASPTVSLTAPNNNASFVTPINITVSANASDADGSVSKEDFYAGTSLIGTDTSTPYSVTWNNVATGGYALTAVATDNNGASTISSPVNISVNLPNLQPTVSMTAPGAGLTFPAGSSINLAANATDVDGTITKVDFYSGANLLGTDTTAPYAITWANAAAGAHSLTAVATDNNGATGASSPVAINVVWQTGFTPAADAYVKDGASAGTNFGTANELQVQQGATGSNRESYLRFDLTSVNGITRAKLRVFGKLSDTSGTNVPIGAYSVSSTPTWNESGSGSITWNLKPSTIALQSSTTVTDNVARWYEFDVTSYIQAEKTAGRSVMTVALKSLATSSPYATFSSRETTAATDNRPQLVLWSTGTRNALFAVGSSNLNTGDTAVKTRLENLGFTVTAKVANNGLLTADADGKALVVISSTVNDGNVTNKFRYVAVPVVSWEALVLDDMGMTGTTAGNFGTTTGTQTNLNVINSTHPLAAGFSGSVPVSSPATNLTWGIPSVNAVTIATPVGDATKFVIFGYDKGATMSSLDAPARRVSLFMTDVTAANNFGNTTAGGPLFDAAIKWATEVITLPTITTISPTSGPAGTSVTINGLNFGATQGTSVLTFNGVSATATTWADNKVVTTVPVYATTGPVVITVSGFASNGLTFTVGNVDSDGDGLPDWWELQYFGNLSQTASGDPDSDGLTNLQEYQQGRNPTKAAQADDGTGVNLKVHTPLASPSP